MNIIAILILSTLLINAVVGYLADRLNLKQLRTTLPEAFDGWYKPERYAAAQQYLRDNIRFGWFVGAFDLSVVLVFWFGGVFAYLDQWVRGIASHPIASGFLFIGSLAALKAFASVPFSLYTTFVIEERYGFNKTTVGTFFKDWVKGVCLAVLLGGPLLAAVLVFFEYAGAYAWFYCWLATVGYMLVVQYVAPAWIMPLFNRFEPLPDGRLRRAITDYAERIDFELDNIYIMDGSKRSSKSNAFFTGFGRHRRIVLFDTLIEKHTVDELVAVLAHEMGHYKQRHIVKMMLIGVAQGGILFYLLSIFISYQGLFDAFFVPQVSVYAGLVFFSLLFVPIDGILSLFVQMVSRRHEYAADRFAVETVPNGFEMITALKKLSVDNLSNLRPHPLYVFLHYSHPPVLERIAAIERQLGTNKADAPSRGE